MVIRRVASRNLMLIISTLFQSNIYTLYSRHDTALLLALPELCGTLQTYTVLDSRVPGWFDLDS